MPQIIRLVLLTIAALLAPGTAGADVLFKDSSIEISASGPRQTRSCAVAVLPARMLGDRPPQLLISLRSTSIDTMTIDVEEISLYQDIVLIQNNERRDLVPLESGTGAQVARSDIWAALGSGQVFFLTARLNGSNDYVSSRFEGIDFDQVLQRIGEECPFDAEAFMSNTDARLRAEAGLGLDGEQMRQIRRALSGNSGPHSAGPLQGAERDSLKRYTVERGFPISRYLTRDVALDLMRDASGTMDRIARDFMRRFHLVLSGPADAASAEFRLLYAPSVDFYGKRFSLREILADKANILTRWPQRSYEAPDEEMSVRCDPATEICEITAIVYWSVSSRERGKRSSGVSRSNIRLDLASGVPVIVYENGETLVRH